LKAPGIYMKSTMKYPLKAPDIHMKSTMKYPGAKNEISIESTRHLGRAVSRKHPTTLKAPRYKEAMDDGGS